jgi:hypothetical protein
MAQDQWGTYQFEFGGGLLTNLSPLQLGSRFPGSARTLRNFEPSVEGGYRRIEGFSKYDTDHVPPYGDPRVQGSSQTGTTLDVANLFTEPQDADTFILTHATADVDGITTDPETGEQIASTSLVVDNISGTISAGMIVEGSGIASGVTVSAFDAGTSTITLSTELALADNLELTFKYEYTIGTGGVTYSSANKSATLTLTEALKSSPDDQSLVEFGNTEDAIEGVAYFRSRAIAYRNSDLFESSGSGWTKINVPDYGTVLVDGGSQTGTSLDVDGIDTTPQVGDTFTVAGIEKVYTITAAVTVTSGAATLTINPSLASSPADDAVITFLSTGRPRSAGKKHRFVQYRFANTDRLLFVDGTNAPAYYDGNTFVSMDDAPSAVIGADHVAMFKNHAFYGKDNQLTFSSPYDEDGFNAANGAGDIDVGSAITGLVVFREQLIIFCEQRIMRLAGNTIADFQLQSITDDIGCIETDTIQEVGGDIIFLAPDGLRMISGTERIGDFGLAVISKVIQSEFDNFITKSTSYSSIVVREKSQYRLFGYNDNITEESSVGILGTQFSGQGGENMAWAELRGIRAYVTYSVYTSTTETILFANVDGYVYQMESGNSFDGEDIIATFSTPFVSINDDPRLRKTFYKLFLYADPQGSVTTNVSLKYDFDTEGTIQPTPIELSNATGAVGFYGDAVYGSTTYGTKLKKLFGTQVIGSGFTVSLQFISEGTDPPFSLDATTLEYAVHGRR